MARHETFRHPYEELRQITALPLSEVAVIGGGAPVERLAGLLQEAAEVTATRTDGWTARTRLAIVGPGAEPAPLLEQAPPPRTCVVLATAEGFPADRLPLPGMCLRAELSVAGDGLHAVLLPRAATIPEALELVAELLYAVGVSLEQRPVDTPPE